MNQKLKNKSGNFGFGIFIIFLAMAVSLFAFINEENKTTGFAVLEDNEEGIAQESMQIISDNLIEFNGISSLSTLAPGNYFIDGDGIVYWIDDDSRPAIAIVKIDDETQKNRHIYIDDEGRIGYVLNSVLINENIK